MIVSGGRGPATDRRWMLFVDGENLTIRAEQLNFGLVPGTHYLPGVFVWLPDVNPRQFGVRIHPGLLQFATRSYYYTSLVGDRDKLMAVREQLWRLHFDAQIFQKDKGQQKSKGVDVTLTKDVLSHAFLDHYDAAVLIAGDGDYIPLVRQLKQLGKIVCVSFFADQKHGMNPHLRLESDYFFPLDGAFQTNWPRRT